MTSAAAPVCSTSSSSDSNSISNTISNSSNRSSSNSSSSIINNGRDTVLVPLGGGKDSLVAWMLERNQGHNIDLLYIENEVGEFNKNTKIQSINSVGVSCKIFLLLTINMCLYHLEPHALHIGLRSILLTIFLRQQEQLFVFNEQKSQIIDTFINISDLHL